jgi:hypothetical protein
VRTTAQACRTGATTVLRTRSPGQPPQDLIGRPGYLRKTSIHLPPACNLRSYPLAELRATPFTWGGKRSQRCQRARVRRDQRLAGSGARCAYPSSIAR